MLFEIADGGGVVYWQKLILCCSAGGLQAVADKMNQAGGDVTNIIEQAPLPALAALRRRHKPHLPAGGVVEKTRATPESLLCRCEECALRPT
ncbi:pyridine nucleotide-disulfide oxidoreductase [Klebsiella pneumoniae]|uniref:Pyridine nucleotide-disulfide oxidoreductase n=1 Tax=Klebsiella pneumoniae TaxID=573 RepID=A0A378BCZ3_KLEPN|nr:pyridine nucleotide-disulfide oxidoreductase [Klebsiella pneumoniae]